MSESESGVLRREWLENGFFDLDSRVLRAGTFTLRVRDALASELGGGIACVGYPERQRFRHAFYWRTGGVGYREAQFFASIDRDHPVLSIGVSVEKGVELKGAPADKLMDRRLWDWARLIERAEGYVNDAIPRVFRRIRRPIALWIEIDPPSSRGGVGSRTYVHGQAGWIQRHEGPVGADSILSYLQQADAMKDAWVDLRVGYDLTAGEVPVAGVPPANFAARLLAFDDLRRYIRSN